MTSENINPQGLSFNSLSQFDVEAMKVHANSITTCTTNASGQTGSIFDFVFLSPYPTWHLILFGFLASSVGLVTIGGNLVVILSFVVVPSIRQPTNYFIASLAVSDLLIGVVSMPFYTVYLLFGEVWPLGENLCDLWLSVDYTLCMCSIYTVFCITVDRFCSVKIPARYRKWRTGRKIGIAICMTWTIPMVVFFTSIFGWQYFVGKRTVPPLKCYVQYMEDALFNSLLQIGYFWITLAAMITLYVGIYKVALDLHKRSSEKRDKNMACLVSMAGKTVSQIGTVITMGYRSNEPNQPQPYPRYESPDYYNIVYNATKDLQNDLKPIPEFSEPPNQSESIISKRPSRISIQAFFNQTEEATVINNQDFCQQNDPQKSSPYPLSSTMGYRSPHQNNLNESVKDDNKDYFKATDDKENLLSPPNAKEATKPCIVITNEVAEGGEGGQVPKIDHVVIYAPESNNVSNGNDKKMFKCYSSQYNFQGSMCRFYPVMRPHSTQEIFVRPMTEELSSDVLGFGKPTMRKSYQNQHEVFNWRSSRNCMVETTAKPRDNYGSFSEVKGRDKVVGRLSTINLNNLSNLYDNQKQALIENYLSGINRVAHKSEEIENDEISRKHPSRKTSPIEPSKRPQEFPQVLLKPDRSPCCQCAGKECAALDSETNLKSQEKNLNNSHSSMSSTFFNLVNLPNPSSLHILSPIKHHISSAYSGLHFPHIFGFVPQYFPYQNTSEQEAQRSKTDNFEHSSIHKSVSDPKQSISQANISSEAKESNRSKLSIYLDFLKPASMFLSKLFDRTPSDDGFKSVVIENPHVSDGADPGSLHQRDHSSSDSVKAGIPGKTSFNLSSRIMEAIRSRSPSTVGKGSVQDAGNSDDDDDDDDDEEEEDDDDDSCSSHDDENRSFKVLSNFGQSSIAFATIPSGRTRGHSPSQIRKTTQPKDSELNSRSELQEINDPLTRFPSQNVSPSNSDVGTKRCKLNDPEQGVTSTLQTEIHTSELCQECQQQQEEEQQKLFLQTQYQQQQLHEQKQQQRLASQHTKYKNRTRKALKTITIILGAFVTCWTPWHVLSMIMGFCSNDLEGCVSPTLYSISYWLCYLNSPINPFCYAFANQQFKQAFLRIIKFDWKKS